MNTDWAAVIQRTIIIAMLIVISSQLSAIIGLLR